MLWRAVQLRSGLLVAVLISDSVLAAPAEQGRQVGEPVWITVQRDEEIPFKFWEGAGKRGTLVCPRTHPYLLNRHIGFVGKFAVARGVEITTNSAVNFSVIAENGNTPAGSRAMGATFSARHNDPFAFTSSEHFTMVIHCSNDPNESYSGPG